MKTTKRSKMLLSSIAMLLVALVALGSATFAWYYTNASVTASESSYKAAVDSGLVIKHHAADATWGSSITDLLEANSGNGLTPSSITYASTLTSTRGGTATSTAYDVSTMDESSLGKVTIENGSNFLVDEFYVASDSGAAQTATLVVSGGSAVSGGYLNIAIYVDGNLKKVLTNDTDFDASVGFGKLKNATSGDGVEADTAKYTTNVAKFTGTDTVATDLSCTTKTAGGCHVQIVAFADGFNANCKSSSVSDAVSELTYTVTANS